MFSTAASPRSSSAAKVQAPGWLSHLTAKLRSAVSSSEKAQSLRHRHDCLPDAAFHDAGLSRDDALGIGRHQPELPFFLQSGFSKR